MIWWEWGMNKSHADELLLRQTKPLSLFIYFLFLFPAREVPIVQQFSLIINPIQCNRKYISNPLEKISSFLYLFIKSGLNIELEDLNSIFSICINVKLSFWVTFLTWIRGINIIIWQSTVSLNWVSKRLQSWKTEMRWKWRMDGPPGWMH